MIMGILHAQREIENLCLPKTKTKPLPTPSLKDMIALICTFKSHVGCYSFFLS